MNDHVASSETDPGQTSHFRRNWFSYAMLIGIVLALLNVDQVNHLFERPRFDTGADKLVVIGLYAYLASLLAIYLIMGAWVVPFRSSRVQDVSQTPVHVFLRDRHKQLALGFGIASLILLACGILFPGLPYLLDSSILFTFFGFCLAATLIFGLWPRLALATQRLLLRSLIVLSVLNLLGEVVWILAHESSLFSPRNYSIWAILHVLFCAFLFARVVDVWQSYSRYPVRGVGVVLAVIVFGLSGPTSIGKPKPVAALAHPQPVEQTQVSQERDDGEKTVDAWLAHVKARLDQIPGNGPVILVAASGGGSRAALFTALVYEELERAPITYTFQGQQRSYDPAKHILMISSVSGGTLASSCYLDPTYRDRRVKKGTRAKLRHSIEEEMPDLMRKELAEIGQLPWYRRVDPETDEVIVDFAALAAKELDEKALPLWFFRRSFVDDMCTDFMAPLLRGVLHPGRDRGRSVRMYWEERFGMEQTNLDWVQHHVSGNKGVSPVLLCNVCEVERGSRLIIGFPPLPPGFLESGGRASARAWVDLGRHQNIVMELNLAAATRISANFPWGFPVSRIPVAQYDQFDKKSQADVRLIDGGVCDNTGVDSLRYLIESLEKWAPLQEPEAGLQNSRHEIAASIVEEMAKRGVILLEIDSGAKPESPGFIARQLSGYLEPIRSLQNAGYASALSALETHVDVIERSLPNSKSSDLTRRIEQLRTVHLGTEQLTPLETSNVKRLTITCNHADNVMTAWALGPSDKAQIFVRFLVESERLRYELGEYLTEYETTRTAVDELAARVTQLEQMDSSPSDAVTEVVSLRNNLVESSLAAQNLDALRISSEKAFYRGMTVSKDELQRIDDAVRTKPAGGITVPEKVVPEVEAPKASLESATSDRAPDDHVQLDKTVQKLDWSIKRQRQNAIERIESLRKPD